MKIDNEQLIQATAWWSERLQRCNYSTMFGFSSSLYNSLKKELVQLEENVIEFAITPNDKNNILRIVMQNHGINVNDLRPATMIISKDGKIAKYESSMASTGPETIVSTAPSCRP